MKTKLIVALFIFFSITAFSQIKVACIGNSITYGAFIANRETKAYPQQLDQSLGDGWKVVNYGSNGATMLKNGDSPYWDLPLYKQAKDFLPDVVIILLGTNDSKPQNWDSYKNDFKSDYMDMIKEVLELDSKPEIFLGIPVPVVKDKFTIRKITVEQTITTIVKQVAEETNLETIDFYSILKGKDELLPDFIHPNAKGAELMANEAMRVLLINKSKIESRIN